MKKLTILTTLLILLIGCNNEIPPCNCQVVGNDSYKETRDVLPGKASLPILIIPYDTIVDCAQDSVSWYKVTETVEPPKTITKTSYRKIQCN